MYQEERPWGKFLKFAENQRCTVKMLIVKSNEELSLQKHEKRTEVWYFLDKAIVQLDKELMNVSDGQIIYVAVGMLHRIKSEGNIVRVLEVSFGSFDEKDEIRIDDKYGREKK